MPAASSRRDDPRLDGYYILDSKRGPAIASSLRFYRDRTLQGDGTDGPWIAGGGQVSFELKCALDRYIGPIGLDSLHVAVWHHLMSGEPVNVTWGTLQLSGGLAYAVLASPVRTKRRRGRTGIHQGPFERGGAVSCTDHQLLEVLTQ